ncbi:MAG: T9SS type B sorting domain-containing protein, partial [Ginsengibacter sp.]
MRGYNLKFHAIIPGVVLCLGHFFATAQSCPPNIDFETGTFKGWACYIGTVESFSDQNVIQLAPSPDPVFNRQTMYTAGTGDGVDPYGGFPVNCPNGSRHSVRLGNNSAGTQAEGLSYDFVIPPNRNTYSLIYYYAVVFQDPDHAQFQQPRLEIEVTNLTDSKLIYCSSFTFIPYGSTLLPGFFESPNPRGDTPVWCKDWSAVSVNLNGNAGKTIRLFFKTADCTFRKHFGYAYLDVNTGCSNEYIGDNYCPDDTAVNLTAPYGYQQYAWYDTAFTKTFGTSQTLRISPPPVTGSSFAVTVVPYHGYGCQDTLYVKLSNTLSARANAGRDTISCNEDPVPIGDIPRPGFTYSWSPAVGLSDANMAGPSAAPDHTTSYILTSRHDGGGCLTTDTVVVKASTIDNTLKLTGQPMYCSNTGDSAVLHVKPTKSIQWLRDDSFINGATQINYRATQSGSYYAKLSNDDGCVINTETQNIAIDDPVPGISYPVQYAIIDLPLNLNARKFGDTVLWSPGTSLDNRTSYTPVFNGSLEQLYTIEIKTAGGCVTVDTQLVKTVKSVEIYVPTAFTPNNDGHNDILRPELRGVKELHYFKIFNRFGQQLYQTTSYPSGWDGTLKGLPEAPQ